MTARTTWPGSNVAGDERRDRVRRCGTPRARPSSATSGGPALAPSLRLAAVGDELLERIEPAVPARPRPARAGRTSPRRTPRSTARSSGTKISSSIGHVLRPLVPARAPRSRECAGASTPAGTAGRCSARRAAAPSACSVLPRVSTDRFCETIASASEHRISGDGMPDFTRLTMSVSAKTPHLAATWCSLDGSHGSRIASSRGPCRP